MINGIWRHFIHQDHKVISTIKHTKNKNCKKKKKTDIYIHKSEYYYYLKYASI